MNIGIFTDTYFPQINGVATSSMTLKTELEKLGHKVYIITANDPSCKEKQPTVFRLPSMPFVFLPTHRMTYMYSPKLILNFKKLKLDVVHTQTEFAIGLFGKVLSEIYKIPLVHTYHTMYEDYVHYVAKGHLMTPNMAKAFSRIFCNRARIVVVPVEKTKQALIEYGVKRQIVVIPTGLNFSNLRRENFEQQEIQDLKKEIGLADASKVIVYVGRIAQEKSLDVVINAMPDLLKKIPDVKLVLVGNGPLINGYKEMTKELNISQSVIFTGGKPYSEIGKYYQIGDVFTTASTSETQGLTYLEAMATHLPVVAKKDQSIEGIIKNGETGYIFEKDEELSEVLYQVLTNEKDTAEIAQNGYNSIQHLSAEQFAKNIEELYINLIEDNKQEKSEIKRTFSIKFKHPSFKLPLKKPNIKFKFKIKLHKD